MGRVRLPMTDEAVLVYLRQHLTGVDSTFLAPAIAEKKLASIRKIHAAYLPPNEVVLGLYDGTVFGSASDGFFVTSKRIGFKNQMEPAHFLEWAQVDDEQIYVDDNKLMLGNASIDTLYSADDTALYLWVDVLQTLARSARPPRAARTVPVGPGQSAVPPSGWGSGPSSWPPAPPAFGSSGQVERLPRAPYVMWQSCSVVHVHPSGELVAVCGDEVVELRYSANGGRFRVFHAPSAVRALRFSPDGGSLLLGGLDNRANRYDVRTGAHLGATPPFEDYCEDLVWLGNGATFAMGSQAGELWIVDAATMTVTHPLLGKTPDHAQLGGLCASIDGSVLFASVGQRIGAFDARSGQVLWRFDEALSNPARLAVSPRGDLLVAAGYDGVAMFDARTGRPGARFALPCPSGVSWPEGGLMSRIRREEDGTSSWTPRPKFSPAGDAVALQDHVGNLAFLDVATLTLHPTPREAGRAWIEDLAWFGDGNHLLVGASDNSMAIWHVRPLARVLHAEAISRAP